MAAKRDESLRLFNVSPAVVRSLLSSLRLINGAADAMFYDIGVLYRGLAAAGDVVVTRSQRDKRRKNNSCQRAIGKHIVNLSALANPEGMILVIDALRPPYVTRYADVRNFLAAQTGRAATEGRKVRTMTVTGVGSSALGSAAFAWNISSALEEPVAAIVPGYGLADILPQALGGWFGFGVADFLRRTGQRWLELTAPRLADTGRALAKSVPTSRKAATDTALAFRSGCPVSDILHAILCKAPDIVRLYGHSKGALCIENALRSLPSGRAQTIAVSTFGCAIAEETRAAYEQVLGSIDSLGQINSWGNRPERWIASWHSTNTLFPLAMPVAKLAHAIRSP